MNPILEKLTGTAAMTDQIVAADLLLSAKSGVWTYAAALTETASVDIRAVLRRHLEEAINIHEQVFEYMTDQNWYHPYDPQQQIRLDLQNAETALNIGGTT